MDTGSLTAGGIVALAILQVVFRFLDTKKNGTRAECQVWKSIDMPDLQRKVLAMSTDVKETRDWHAPNSEGRQTWKNADLGEAIEKQAEAMSKLASSVDRLERSLRNGKFSS